MPYESIDEETYKEIKPRWQTVFWRVKGEEIVVERFAIMMFARLISTLPKK